MPNGDVVIAESDAGLFRSPWPFALAGLGLSLAAAGLSPLLSGPWLGFMILVLAIGVLATSGSLVIRPGSSELLGIAALVALIASLALNNWDASRLLFRVLAIVAGASALLMLLPSSARRVFVSLMILFHFGGIMTAVTAAAPQSWISGQLWTCVYRPYLQFMYLNNAYHFYSPEPGPASLLWFRIEYASDPDGTRNWRWIKLPELDANGKPVRPGPEATQRYFPYVNYTRRLSLSESTNQPGLIPQNMNWLQGRRLEAGNIQGIPPHPEIPVSNQYMEPHEISKRWIQTYAHHVAKTFKHETKPHLEVTGVKVYKVIHRLLQPGELVGEPARNIPPLDPQDPVTYMPYYQGEFDKDGHMKASCKDITYHENGLVRDMVQDPFLYWLIPILKIPKEMPAPEPPPITPMSPFRTLVQPESNRPQEYEVKNYLLIHAGDEEGR